MQAAKETELEIDPLAPPKHRWLWLALTLVIAAGAALAFIGWYRFFREEAQPAWVTATPEMRFKYGSIGAERDAGIPYWIFYVLPRIFPEKLPGPGGYASLGVAWEQGQELPIGFTKKTIGFPRVANTCAACHTASYRSRADENPTYVVAGPGHTLNLEAFFRYLIDCAKDPRFTPDVLLTEIALVTELDWLDKLAYRFLIIPMTKKRLLEREAQFAWIYRKDFPDWGRGRDDAMNLTKYFMIKASMDDSFGPTDMPSLWNLNKYQPEKGHVMNFAGDSHDARSVIIDSALGVLGAAPHDRQDFLAQVAWLHDYLGKLPAPKYPFPIDADRAAAGKTVFDAHCAGCHQSDRTGTRLPLAEIGTDRSRLDSWNKGAAIEANRVVRAMGIARKGLVEETLDGYVIQFLDGIWLRAPYLHNGSVPTLRDLLEPPARRPVEFLRGYDVYDQEKVGFVTEGPEAERVGTRYDTQQRGNGNGGHLYGTDLSGADKAALVEYLKTL
ncbi:MAG TPA: c-type cytochrome [Aromatoleum sp.]|uniref:c-type cytochrome n=1 Tax=Aromatoleum sp. TaxID=2307007 RepID=UPI002B468F66|nr:c-type cytochrome [Aromatoleum sp.]HJV25258.1 c-type cytochrome [Aromatoleum sp.]